MVKCSTQFSLLQALLFHRLGHPHAKMWNSDSAAWGRCGREGITWASPAADIYDPQSNRAFVSHSKHVNNNSGEAQQICGVIVLRTKQGNSCFSGRIWTECRFWCFNLKPESNFLKHVWIVLLLFREVTGNANQSRLTNFNYLACFCNTVHFQSFSL